MDDKYVDCSPASPRHVYLCAVRFRIKIFPKSLTSASRAGNKGVNYQAVMTVNLFPWPAVTKLTSRLAIPKDRNDSELGLTCLHPIQREHWAGWGTILQPLRGGMRGQPASEFQEKMLLAVFGAETSCRKGRQCPGTFEGMETYLVMPSAGWPPRHLPITPNMSMCPHALPPGFVLPPSLSFQPSVPTCSTSI